MNVDAIEVQCVMGDWHIKTPVGCVNCEWLMRTRVYAIQDRLREAVTRGGESGLRAEIAAVNAELKAEATHG
jgi:hypothetical protein